MQPDTVVYKVISGAGERSHPLLTAATIVSAVAALIAAYFGSYAKRRGESLATKHDFEQALVQLSRSPRNVEQLERYQEYIVSLSGIVGRRSTPEGQARYSDAFNSLVLVAPAPVLRTLYAFHNEQRINNTARTAAAYEKLQNELLRELRRDVHPYLNDHNLEFFLIDAAPADSEVPVGTELKLVPSPRA